MPHGASRLAQLRGRFASSTKAPLVCFLDDDNWWQPDHLHSLIETMDRTGAAAVHSWCQVMNEEGEPFVGEYDPWTSGWDEATATYTGLVAAGVVSPRTNVFRDRADPAGTYPGALSVDAGEWLLSSATVREVGYPTELDQRNGSPMLGDDDLFLRRLLDAGVSIACTGRPTLCYQLGGFSTARTPDGKLLWQGK